MSVTALRLGPASPWPRLLTAVAAVLLVGGATLLIGAWLAPAAPPPARSPFGMGIREAAPAASGLGGLLLAWQGAFFASLRSALSALRSDGISGLGLLLGIGFAYGVFHAAGPGHGKAVIAAYIVSSERALLRGLGVSFAAALIQAAVAILLVTAVFLILGGTAAAMSRTVQVSEIGGFAVVVILGLVLVWRKAGKVLAAAGPDVPAGADPDGCACHPVAPPSDGSWTEMAAVALGAGIRPCAGAIVVLTLAASWGLFAAGVAATLAMALGTALTTGALAALAIYAKRLALRLASGRGRTGAVLGAAAELAAAALVLVIGAALLLGVWTGGA
ncbi:nickel transporter [Enterovirga sp.]|uniref:nickel/cobalt transporter n=1 Tax=Enterovirga sp. TaxID=2026350 RepID=UPI00261CDE0A|nr:nickel transporter [Enterovirga sp.]MDB5591079.1 nickel transporter [Enterovirga sp.]